MPPQRTFPTVKPLKTERTHEENQERAYIAASRRSDRSLEARVESARRASEIHKRRTGRSLRVTEQDVINEEMYEEEDDDMPSQYRRLTAHLQTGSAEFNRRLQTYLANHVAMRTALNDAIHSNFSQHYPNAPQFAHNGTMFPSPLMTQNLPTGEPVRSPPAASPHAYRSAPYPTTGRPSFRGQVSPQQQQQQQPPHSAGPVRTPGSSFAAQRLNSNPNTPGSEMSPMNRRMSMPATKTEQPDFHYAKTANSPLSDSAYPLDVLHQKERMESPSPFTNDESAGARSDSVKDESSVGKPHPGNIPNFPSQNPYGPFSMALPMESQQMVNQAALPQNYFGAALMAGSENWMFDSSSLGASNPGEMLKSDSNFYPNTVGMNSTLLQDYSPLQTSAITTKTMAERTDANAMLHAQGLDFGQFLDFGGSNSSNAPSGAGTPADDTHVWKDMVESGWVEDPSAT